MKLIANSVISRFFGDMSCTQIDRKSDLSTTTQRTIWLMIAIVFFCFQIFSTEAIAAEFDAGTRTLPLNDAEETMVISLDQIQQGKRLFDSTCSQCHASGTTKTNPIVGLNPESLANATPRRDTVDGMVDYLHNPTTYDGEKSIAELHPSTSSSDIYPEMRNLTDADLKAISGYILLQPKVIGQKWGGGKIYY